MHVKSHIQEKVDIFTKLHFIGNKVLGIHMRGTDKGAANAPPALMKVIKPRACFSHIDDYTKQNGRCKIFVATDQQQFLDQLKTRYGDRIVSYDAIRASDDRNPFDVDRNDGYQKGEEVLIDCLLLSRCDYLLKCTSAVGEFAMYFNPSLSCIDLNHLLKRASAFTRWKARLKRRRYTRYLHEKWQVYKRAGKIMRELGQAVFYHDLQCISGYGDRLLDTWAALTIARLHRPDARVKVRWREGKTFIGFTGTYATDYVLHSRL
ncbi:MAG: hypothetical protein ACI9FD_001134 [Gammaproteobacteria bacterium]